MQSKVTTTKQVESEPSVGKKRVFSGIQPTGEVQRGNYLGAIKGWAERQAQKENFFCIVDLHAYMTWSTGAVFHGNG